MTLQYLKKMMMRDILLNEANEMVVCNGFWVWHGSRAVGLRWQKGG